MNETPCIRCHQPVQLENGHLVYCSHCGAPQIFLSEELQDQLTQSSQEYEQRNTPSPTPPSESPAPRWTKRRSGLAGETWPLAVQYALLSGAVTLVLGFVSILLPPVGALMLVWVLGAPILTVTLFNSRARTQGPAVPTAGFTARLGMLTAALVVLGCAVVFTLALVLKRFVFHNAGPFDAQLAAGLAQQRELLLQRFGSDAQPTLNMLNIPEFRVGIMLLGCGFFACLYLLLSTVAAAVAGLALRRRPTP